MKKYLVVIIGGASNSSTDRDEQVRTLVLDKLKEIKWFKTEYFRIVDLSSFGKKRQINEWFGKLNPSDYLSLSVFGKSLGGVRLMQAFNANRNIFNEFFRVALMFIDAHSPIPNYYGSLRGFQIDNSHIANGWYSNIHGWNVYQRNEGSEGCSIKFMGPSKTIEIKDANVDHFNIVTKKETSVFVEESLRWSIYGETK